MDDRTYEVLETTSGIDQVTLNTKCREAGAAFAEWWEEEHDTWTLEGWKLKESVKGNWTRKTVNGVRLATSTLNMMQLSVSGQNAGRCNCLFHLNGLTCSRIDLQVTLLMSEERRIDLMNMYKYLRNANSEGSLRASVSTTVSDTGQTVYVGKRQSGLMIRVYDKGMQMETHGSGMLVRWEVEYRKRKADVVFNILRSSEHLQSTARSMVVGEMRKRGIFMPQFDYASATRLEFGKKLSDSARQLHWLNSQVRPVIDELRSAGMTEEVSSVLGVEKWRM